MRNSFLAMNLCALLAVLTVTAKLNVSNESRGRPVVKANIVFVGPTLPPSPWGGDDECWEDIRQCF